MLKCLDFTFDITTFIYLHLKKMWPKKKSTLMSSTISRFEQSSRITACSTNTGSHTHWRYTEKNYTLGSIKLSCCRKVVEEMMMIIALDDLGRERLHGAAVRRQTLWFWENVPLKNQTGLGPFMTHYWLSTLISGRAQRDQVSEVKNLIKTLQ